MGQVVTEPRIRVSGADYQKIVWLVATRRRLGGYCYRNRSSWAHKDSPFSPRAERILINGPDYA